MTTTTERKVRKTRRPRTPEGADRKKAVQSLVYAAYLHDRLPKANLTQDMRRCVRAFVKHCLDEVDQFGDATLKAASRLLREKLRSAAR